MRPIDHSLTDADLQKRRSAIRRDLVRGNTTAILLLVALVGLALLAALQASRAEAARRQATEKLWESYRAQARAARLSGEAGRRDEALSVIAAAAKIRAAPDLTMEAIAALALTDIRPAGTFIPFTREAFGVTFSSDLSMYGLMTADRVEIRSLEPVRVLMIGKANSAPYAARFSADAKKVAIHFTEGLLEVREIESANLVWSLQAPPNQAIGFDFSPDSRQLACRVTTNRIAIIDLESKKEAFSVEALPVQKKCRFSPDGKLLAVYGGTKVTIWSLDERRKLRDMAAPRDINDLAWHHDSSEVAVGCEDNLVHLWDVATGQEATLEGHTREVVSLAFSPVSDLLVSYAWDGTTRFWNARTGDQLLKTHLGWGLSFSADGKKLAFLKHNAGFGIWDVEESSEMTIVGNPLHSGWFMRWADFSPDGTLLAIAYYNQVQIWRPDTRTMVGEIPAQDIKTAAFTKTGESIVVSDVRGAREWRLNRKGEHVEATEVAPPMFDKSGEKSFVFSPRRDKAAVAGGRDGKLTVIDAVTREQKEVGKQFASANIALSPDAHLLAVGTWKGSGTRVWDIANGKVVRDLDRRDATTLFDPRGQWLVTGHSDEYCFWNTQTWSNTWSVKRDVPSEATGPMSFSPDGKTLAVTLNGWSLDLIDMERRAPVTQLISPVANALFAFAWSDDGKRLAAASAGGYVQLWDLPRIRNALAERGLGFLTDSQGLNDKQPKAFFSSRLFTTVILTAVLSSLLVGMNGLKRHRRLVEEYSFIEKLVVERNAQVEGYRTELAHSQKMRALGTLATGIAHDFNNLLSVIRMANKLTSKEVQANPDVAANVAAVEQAVAQGKHVVKSMLGYSRASERDGAAYSLAEMVENVVPLLSKQFLAGISLTLELDYTAPAVTPAQGRLQQVLLNLIVNASEAMEGEGKLTIAVKTERELTRQFVLKPAASQMYVRLSVADSGPGIPNDVLPRIFEPFFTTKNLGADPGTGLGLSLVYTVAQEEGLGLAVDNAPGAGATFHIFVPANCESSSIRPEEPKRLDRSTDRVVRA